MLKPVFAFVEYMMEENNNVHFKSTIVDVTPLIDGGCTSQDDAEEWAIEKNCSDGWTLHHFNFFDNYADAYAWISNNHWN